MSSGSTGAYLRRSDEVRAAQAEAYVVRDIHMREQRIGLKSRVHRAAVRRQPGDVLAAEADPPGPRPHQADDGGQQGRLTGPVGADDGDDLARARRKSRRLRALSIERHDTAPTGADAAGDHRRLGAVRVPLLGLDRHDPVGGVARRCPQSDPYVQSGEGGDSGHRGEYEQVGLPFESAGVRISRLEEALHIIKQFFTEETVNFAGKYYTVNGLKAFPKPAQHPYPPIFIGGGGKRLLSIAGREADIVGLHLKVNDDGTVDAWERSEEGIAQKVEWVRQAVGERFDALEFNFLMRTVIIAEDRQQAAEEYIRERGRSGMTAEQLLASPYVLIGSVEHLVERLHQLREVFGVSYFVVGDEYMELFAPIVGRLAGRNY